MLAASVLVASGSVSLSEGSLSATDWLVIDAVFSLDA